MSGGLLLAMLLLPMLGAAVVAPMRTAPVAAKGTALLFALVELVLAGVAWSAFQPGGGRLQLTLSVPWIPAFGTRFALGVDGIALVMVALIAVLVPIVMGSSWAEKLPEGRTPAGFYAMLLALESLLVGVFVSTDVFLFYLFFEVMLASVIGLFVVSGRRLGHGTFDWSALQRIAGTIPTSTQIWLFLGFFIAFAIKAPLVPFHTWLPDAGAEAPVGVGVLLVGVMDKVGIYGFLRYCLPLFPAASRTLAPLVLVLAIAGIIYAALLAVGQSDMKRFVAYTSVAHFGFIALGVFAFSTQAQAGAVLYMVNHGISTGMLFIVVGMLIARGGSRLISDYGGVSALAPMLAGMMLLAGLSALALPGTNSFVSEFMVLIGSYPRQPVATVIGTAGIILAALYVLWFYQRLMQGPVRGSAVTGNLIAGSAGATLDGPGAATAPGVAPRHQIRFPDLSIREVAVLVPLVALILLLGFFPQPVLNVITPSVGATVTEVGLSDPVGQGGS
ncbi:MAG TPA: NADH-quinone oxidoreductase subunit M [Pseudonocardiaceae bacterium]|nr:NADH-quinone oxidoreductase subunit M [Pseudonocardiaceae bacterium]